MDGVAEVSSTSAGVDGTGEGRTGAGEAPGEAPGEGEATLEMDEHLDRTAHVEFRQLLSKEEAHVNWPIIGSGIVSTRRLN